MKNYFFLVLSLLLSTNILMGQAQRKILFEEFTNASIPASALQNPDFDSLMLNNWNNITLLKYPLAWNNYADPLFEQDSVEIQSRANFYNVSGMPEVYMDGNVIAATPPSTITQASIDSQLLDSSYISMDLSHSLQANLDFIDIQCTIRNEQSSTQFFPGRQLHVIIVEKEIAFDFPIGANGEMLFRNIIRKYVTELDSASSFLPAIPAGDSLVYNWTVPIPDHIYRLDQIAVVAFIQSDGTKTVFQSAYSDAQALAAGVDVADLTARSITDIPTDFCDYSLSPTLLVNNIDTATVDSFQAAYSLNNGPWIWTTYNSPLAASQSDTIYFPQITVNPGYNNIRYKIDSLNAGNTRDLNQANNTIEDDLWFNLQPNAVDTTIQEDFELYALNTEIPNNSYLENPNAMNIGVVDSNISAAVSWNLGAYGNSDASYRFDLWNSLPGDEAVLIFEKIDFTNIKSIQFDYAYAQVSSESDSLQLWASDDCGQNWTMLWSKAGAALASTNPFGSNSFYPLPTEWATDSTNMGIFAGHTEVNLAFRVVSDYGNNIYLDNIQLQNDTVEVVISPIETFENLNGTMIYPNPADKYAFIDLNMEFDTKLQLLIINQLGQQVMNSPVQLFSGQNQVRINSAQYANGQYRMMLVDDQQKILKTASFIVQH